MSSLAFDLEQQELEEQFEEQQKQEEQEPQPQPQPQQQQQQQQPPQSSALGLPKQSMPPACGSKNSTNSGGTPASTSHHRNSKRNSKDRVVYGRILFVLVLCSVATVFGVVAHRLLSSAEQNLAEQQFDSIADRALLEAYNIAHRRFWAGVTMSRIVSELHPTAEEWPFVPFWGFERLAEGLLSASSGVDMGFVPLVWPEQQAKWEDFAYTVYDQLGWPNTTAYKPPFGRGIFAVDNTKELPYNRYHDHVNLTRWNSTFDVLTPVFRTNDGNHPVLLYNPHSDESRGRAIESMMECAEQYSSGQNAPLIPLEVHCGVMTQFIQNVKYNGRLGITSFRPIAPRDSPKMVGFIPTLLILDEMLENAFADKVSGVDAVFETETQKVTFTVVNGRPQLVGEDDFHNRKYDAQVLSITLYEQGNNSTSGSVSLPGVVPQYYRLHLYPNDQFYEVYETNNPLVATVGSVCVILITSLCFFLYDFFVRREFHAKRELLQVRRQFMRFVSHEVSLIVS
jgi:hypothetical protein